MDANELPMVKRLRGEAPTHSTWDRYEAAALIVALYEALEPFAAQATERDKYTSGRVEITVAIPALRRAGDAIAKAQKG